MNTHRPFPFYARASMVIIGLFVTVNILYIGRDIILPVLYALIIAIAISPMVNLLVRKKINRAVAIALVLLIAVLIVSALIALLITQAGRLSEAWPRLVYKFQELAEQVVNGAADIFGISALKINAWIDSEQLDFINNSGAAIGSTLTTIGEVLAGAFLTPVFIFMLLFYQPHLVEFIHRVFGANYDSKVSDILTQTKSIIQSYLAGLLAETAIVATMNSIGLLIIGIDYAILLGIGGALLNIIPYLGGLVAVVIFMMVALLTKAPVYVLYVFLLYVVIQFIDNNYIVPKIVGSKVRLNALICIVGVMAGAAIWGIPGMFLAIPLLAIMKLIFDRIDSLKPWGFLLGETVVAETKPKFNFPIKGFIRSITSKT